MRDLCSRHTDSNRTVQRGLRGKWIEQVERHLRLCDQCIRPFWIGLYRVHQCHVGRTKVVLLQISLRLGIGFFRIIARCGSQCKMGGDTACDDDCCQ